MMPNGWEGNHRSGDALAMHHRLEWFIHRRAQWLTRGRWAACPHFSKESGTTFYSARQTHTISHKLTLHFSSISVTRITSHKEGCEPAAWCGVQGSAESSSSHDSRGWESEECHSSGPSQSDRSWSTTESLSTAEFYIATQPIRLCLSLEPPWCTALGTGSTPIITVPRSTQPSNLCGTLKWVSAFKLSNNNKWWWRMWMVAADRQTHNQGWLVWSGGWQLLGTD